MIADPLIHPSYMAQRFVKPFTLFMSDLVRQKPGSCLVEDAVAYLQKNASLLGRNIGTVTDAAAHFERERYERSLYDSYPFAEAGIYGLPDLFYNSSPQAAVYYCEHKDLRQNQFAKTIVQTANETTNVVTDATVFLAEGLLLLQAALYFCSKYNSLKGLFGWACNAEMLQLLKPFITKRKGKDALPVLEISDITALPYVQHYLQTNGFMQMSLAQTHLKAKIFSKCVLEADDTVLLFFGWG
ncbi:MAG: hypothetical protein K2Q24_16240 [Chitinophagaceae bacterium]|jgi:hypothetical protein|nr:hypothetical protein [Chitinophagaceae bacterium]